ncbi:autotransporter-associated beta strand repeat-containing protein [Verrucomicrobium sp. BvORR106]|uniref:beta strand repeat-containing protein n=1 Tax=Verrucomicrobium sp. BvORR106 TaxID=1403819 RepID=UPI002240FCDA|nr:autotransporter-associated beta strand repeat-containing protein [Verrucomicrobium sp. BvORR106]
MIALVLQLLQPCSAKAESITWSNTTGTWSQGYRWGSGISPTSSSSTTLTFLGSSNFTTTNDLGSFALNQLNFLNSSGTVTLNASPITDALEFVADTTPALPSINVSGGGNATISAPVIWRTNGLVTRNSTGTLLFSGAQTYTNGTKVTYVNNGAGTLTLADNITYASTGTGTGVVLNLINNSSTTFLNLGNVGALNNVTINIGGTGTVRFNGSSGGDLFSGSAVLNVLAGATFDFGTNGETMGAISGEGNIKNGSGITSTLAGYYQYSGVMSGVGTLAVGGANTTFVVAGSNNTYTGTTSVSTGRLVISATALSGTASALGNASSDVLVGGTSGSGNAAFLIDGAGVTMGRNIRLQSGNTGNAVIGGLNTTGTVTYSGNIILGTNAGVAKGLVVSSAAGGTVAIIGNIVRATDGTGSGDTLTVNGAGTVVLSGSNTFAGSTTVNGGTLALDYTTTNSDKISATTTLTLSGGSFSILGSNDAATTQTVGGLVLGSAARLSGGGARLTVTSGLNQETTLNIGEISRSAGSTIDFVTVGSGSGRANITSASLNNEYGILGGYATFQGSDWALVDENGSITRLGSGYYTSDFGAGPHASISSSATLASGGTTAHTLRITGASALTFNASSPGALVLESGGLLMTSSAGNSSIGTTSNRGTLSAMGGELFVHQHSTTGTLTIHSTLLAANVASLTKSGNGTLILTGTNTYTGATYINGGNVSVSATGNLGAATADVFLNGGTLTLSAGSLGTLNAANRVITIGSAGGTLHLAVNQSMEGSGLAGTGTLTLTGPGMLTVGSSESPFTGDIVIKNGTLRMNSPQFDSVSSITVQAGGTYNIDDDGADSFPNIAGGRIIINGDGFGNNGAIRLSDQSTTNYGKDPTSTLSNEIVLQTTSRIQVDNGTAIGSLSTLRITGNISGTGSLVKTGNGVLAVSSRSNTYSGITRIENGILRTDAGNDRLPTGTSVVLGSGANSGALQLNGFSQTIAGLSTLGTGTRNAVIGGSTSTTSILQINNEDSQTYSGFLGGTGSATGTSDNGTNNNLSLIKDGTGLLLLTQANTYTGQTSINRGTLTLGNAHALGGGGASLGRDHAGTTIQSGATLDLNGQSVIQEVLTISGSGVNNNGALVNNSTTAVHIGSGVAALSLSNVTTTGWSASTTVSITPPSAGGTTATAAASLGLSNKSFALTSGGTGFSLTNRAATVTDGGGTGAVVVPILGVTTASYTITAGTTTYSVAPTVTLNGGATAVANLDGAGRVISITITNPGSGFTDTPSISFTGGTVLVAGTNPTGTGNASNFTVTGINVVNPGTGYTSLPTVTITGGTGATATAVDGNFILNGFIITDHGSGYTEAPGVTFNGGSATATAHVTSIQLAADTGIGGTGNIIVDTAISGSHGLTKTGSGTTTLAAANTYIGNTTVETGTLLATNTVGSATGSGSVLVKSGAALGGTGFVGLAPSPAEPHFAPVNITVETGARLIIGTTHNANATSGGVASTLALQAGGDGQSISGFISLNGTIQFDIFDRTAGLNSTSNNDRLVLVSVYEVILSGTLEVRDVTGTSSTWQLGDSWQLIDWTLVNYPDHTISAFDNFILPTLNDMLKWDTSELYTQGIISIVVVPEPSRLILLAITSMALLMRRRRR